MLLKKNRGHQLSALSLCLAVMFAPLLSAQADEPEVVPSDSSATMGAQPTSLSQPLRVSDRYPKVSTPARSASSFLPAFLQDTRLLTLTSLRCFMPRVI